MIGASKMTLVNSILLAGEADNKLISMLADILVHPSFLHNRQTTKYSRLQIFFQRDNELRCM